MRGLVISSLCAFMLGLGAIVAYRLHSEAIAVVAGVVCGVAATLPISLLVLYAARRSQAQPASPAPAAPPTQPTQPQVIVVAPGLPQSQTGWPYPSLPSAGEPPRPQRPPRDFTIIGDGE